MKIWDCAFIFCAIKRTMGRAGTTESETVALLLSVRQVVESHGETGEAKR